MVEFGFHSAIVKTMAGAAVEEERLRAAEQERRSS